MADERKTTAEDLNYGFDWSTYLNGESGTPTIDGANSTWTIEPDDGSLTVSGATNDTTTTAVRLSGGVNGRYYVIRNAIVDTNGNTKEDEFGLRVVE